MSEITRINCGFSDAFIEYSVVENARSGVVICPGGAYAWLSEREAWPVARAFAQAGFQPYILRYTVSPHPLKKLPLRELAWAVREMRRTAGKRVYVCGFSAGGHLAASLGVHWNDAKEFDSDAALSRPDGMILCYPVITTGEYAHKVSIQNLTGGGPELLEYADLRRFVSGCTPPAFIWHTAADGSVPVQNTLLFYNELLRAGVKSELHIFPTGPHGMALATEETQKPEDGILPDGHVAQWFGLCTQWLERADAGLYD